VVLEQPIEQHCSIPVQAGPPLQVVVHMPPVQLLPGGQALSQKPQLFGSVVVSEQPEGQHSWPPVQAGLPLQSVEQMLATQLLPVGQGLPQPPQFCGSLVVSVQPIEQHVRLPEQRPPPLHVIWQSPFAQPPGHVIPQPPQLLGSVWVLVQPEEQHVWVPVQVDPPLQPPPVQLPMTHVWPAPQAMPQPPQSCGFESTLTHALPQHSSPPGQPVVWHVAVWQTPATQNEPAPQTSPQKPQLFGSVRVFTSQPSDSTWLQSAKPGLQPTMEQALATQPTAPFGTGWQTLPQVPQLSGSLWVLAQSAPQQLSLPGQALPTPQGPTHWPPEHVSPPGQALPQVPQFCGSVDRLTSQPSPTRPSQSAKPGSQLMMVHAEPEHPGTALAKGPQTTPQPPQFCGSLVVSEQMGVQHVSPPQVATHWKLSHASPDGHWALVVHCTQTWMSVRQ
jgi:hypothetical protein